MTISHSRRLRQTIERVLPDVLEVSAELADHPAIRALYPEILVNMHQGMRASVSLLKAAAARCRELEGGDPVAAGLAPYFERHVN